jgi:3-methyladenine DNA glycosylase AlkD
VGGGRAAAREESAAVARSSARAVEAELRALGNARDAAFLSGYFKTGRGEYGEGDRFLGIRVPVLRRFARSHQDLPLRTLRPLLRSRWHEVRLFALLVLVRQYARATRAGDPVTRDEIYALYMANLAWVNNWDLVDLSAPGIVGAHLLGRRIAPLRALARSRSVWERRVAMLATAAYTRAGDVVPALEIADLLADDPHDLIHKAAGWMLREVGERDRAALLRFLDRHAATLPRTMLRYAIEHLPKTQRARYLRARTRQGSAPRRRS